MRILLLHLNYAPEIISAGAINTDLAQGLVRRGHEVTMICANPYYPQWRTWPGYRGLKWTREKEHGVEVVRCPIYVPHNPTGLRRIIHYLSFLFSAFFPLVRAALTRKPQFTIVIAPTIMCAPLGWLSARVAGGRSWLHVQDFEVGAAAATGLLKGWISLERIANAFERLMVRVCSHASSISPEMCGRLERLGVAPDRLYELRNWSDLSRITPLEGDSPFRVEWKIGAPHVALYSGNVANKQGIEIVVEAARRLRHRKELMFVVCGEGPNRANLERFAGDLDNIQFHDLQPIERLRDLVGLATIHLLPQKGSAADLLLPSKLTNMLASGRPIVATAAQGTGLAREVKGCGLVCEPDNADAFAVAIETLLDSPEMRASFGKAARSRAETRWDRDAILDRFVERLEGLSTPARTPAMINVAGE